MLTPTSWAPPQHARRSTKAFKLWQLPYPREAPVWGHPCCWHGPPFCASLIAWTNHVGASTFCHNHNTSSGTDPLMAPCAAIQTQSCCRHHCFISPGRPMQHTGVISCYQRYKFATGKELAWEPYADSAWKRDALKSLASLSHSATGSLGDYQGLVQKAWLQDLMSAVLGCFSLTPSSLPEPILGAVLDTLCGIFTGAVAI